MREVHGKVGRVSHGPHRCNAHVAPRGARYRSVPPFSAASRTKIAHPVQILVVGGQKNGRQSHQARCWCASNPLCTKRWRLVPSGIQRENASECVRGKARGARGPPQCARGEPTPGRAQTARCTCRIVVFFPFRLAPPDCFLCRV
jgi:hypothetical protein